jgi:hypothetical protein
MPKKPDTIVLINGLWMTALSWGHWVDYYTDKGYRVIARSCPGMEVLSRRSGATLRHCHAGPHQHRPRLGPVCVRGLATGRGVPAGLKSGRCC